MFRSLNIEVDTDDLYSLLNNPKFVITSLDPYISEGGTCGVLIDYKQPYNEYMRERSPFKRHLEAFTMDHNGESEELNELLESRGIRVLNRIFKFTEVGAKVVLDYEIRTRE